MITNQIKKQHNPHQNHSMQLSFTETQMDQNKKWDSIEHHGVLFPENYKRHNIPILEKGQPLTLNNNQEELATYWSQTLDTQWCQNPHYVNNFKQQFLETFQIKPDFQNLDFCPIKEHLQKMKEERRNDEEQKHRRKKEKEENDKYFGYAIVDGVRQKVNGYLIEPPTLFKGRGIHPKAGTLKTKIMPEQISINIGENEAVPICPMPGHAWGQIMHKHDATWLCGYKDSILKTHKYIFLAANSKFKGLNDRKKYEKARKLKDYIQVIRKDYTVKLVSDDLKNRQIGTATYLIDYLALRAGNEKGKDEADTVGTCSLRVEHIQIKPNYQITFDFYGKDSMRYMNTVKVLPEVWQNMKLFVQNKSKGTNLFDKIDAQSLNDYLKTQMEGLTAKVFRTYNASVTLQKELEKKDIFKLNMDQKVRFCQQADFYDEANKQVALLCNHQKTVRKDFASVIEKTENELQLIKNYIEQLKLHKKLLQKQKQPKKPQEEIVKINEKKQFKKKFPRKIEMINTLINKFSNKIIKEQSKQVLQDKLKKKDQNKQVALGTSKNNYNDPRITVAWCKKNQVKIQKVFAKTLRSKFIWAMYVDQQWQF